MSQKITGKNLHYDQSLPPFLARLKGQHAADADSPDPILASHRRAAKKRSASEEAEDAPLIVDDDGNVVAGLKVGAYGAVTGKREGETEGEDDAQKDGQLGPQDGASIGEDAEKDKQSVAAIGASKKRKAGRVIGGDAEDEHDEDESSSKAKSKDHRASTGAVAVSDTKITDAKNGEKTKDAAKAKKKAKKIKLSFGDDDEA